MVLNERVPLLPGSMVHIKEVDGIAYRAWGRGGIIRERALLLWLEFGVAIGVSSSPVRGDCSLGEVGGRVNGEKWMNLNST